MISQPSGFQWDNASLHDAMEAHFSRFADAPQFKVWLLHARAHVMGSGLLGIMFDQENPQRQGCASFYQSISSGTPADQRTQLYVNVHELGHCFNLFHSFHKSFMSPPLPNRPGSLSWMNYPQNYNPGGGAPGGAAAFWAAFPFEFDDLELAHLRHGFRNDVIMGGNPFGTGAALTGPEADAPTGYTLSIAPYPPRAPLGTPVVVEIMLAAERGRPVHSREQLHPKYGFLEIAVERPGGHVVIHRPPVHSCAMPEIHIADAGEQLPISAYIGYDAVHGHLFADVGTYRLRATYTAPDGVPVASEICTLRVAAPRNDEDEDVADLMLRSQTGMVMTLLGSDSDYLSAGTEAIETILERHAEHPTAVYARLAAGMSAARSFLRVRPDGTTQLRQPDPARADRLLGAAVDASRGSAGLDNLTVYQALEQLARSHQSGGNADRARSVRQDAIALARANEAPTAVVQDLEG